MKRFIFLIIVLSLIISVFLFIFNKNHSSYSLTTAREPGINQLTNNESLSKTPLIPYSNRKTQPITSNTLNNYKIEPKNINTKVYGVTIDDIADIDSTVKALSSLKKRPTARIVFDEWQPATNYKVATTKIKNVANVMGELLDSQYVKEYSLAQYKSRTDEYLKILGNNVDIWEIGNEVNGEWLGSSQDVIAKTQYAFTKFYAAGKKTALTLYYNEGCYENADNGMFNWIKKYLPNDMKNKLNYVWVSYYEEDCNNLRPDWQKVFDQLHKIFPNSKLGIGESGTSKESDKASYLTRYYTMSITTPNYVGGYFWWYFYEDCIPITKPLWSILNKSL